MRLLGLTLSAAILLAVAPASLAAPAPGGGYRDAREQAPPSLIGAWKVDFAASRYASTAPKAHMRTFEYTEGGKVLVTFMTLGANGQASTGHWAVQLDGTPGIEYTRAAGSIAYNVVSLTKADDTTFNLSVARHGKVTQTGVFKLSPEGQTLTYTYAAGSGQNVIVYRRWDFGG